MGILLLYAIASVSRFITEKQIKILAAVWAILNLILLLVVYHFHPFSPFIWLIFLIKIPLVYFWLKLLQTYSDTIGRFLLILILGGVILGIV